MAECLWCRGCSEVVLRSKRSCLCGCAVCCVCTGAAFVSCAGAASASSSTSIPAQRPSSSSSSALLSLSIASEEAAFDAHSSAHTCVAGISGVCVCVKSVPVQVKMHCSEGQRLQMRAS